MTRKGLLLALLLAAPAFAWPVDWVHDVEPGKEKFLKLPRVEWFEVEDPQVAQVEWVADSNELILSGKKAGRTLVLLGAEGKVAAWRVRVGGKPALDDKAYAAAQKACPGLKATPLEGVKLTVTGGNDACRLALLALFQTDAFEARVLELELEAPALQKQLISVQEGLDRVTSGDLKARYVGAGLVLTGKTTLARHRRALWEILRRTIGRFALDDAVEVEAPADAGK